MKKKCILIVDDDAAWRKSIADILRRNGYDSFEMLEAEDGDVAVETFRRHHTDIECVILDFDMPRMDGIEAAKLMHAITAVVPMMIFSRSPNQPDGGLPKAAHEVGPYFVQRKLKAILNLVERIVKPGESFVIPDYVQILLEERGLVCKSPAMKKVITKIVKLARTDRKVIFEGETGTGKNILAELLHSLSKRCNEKFKTFNCAHHAGDKENFTAQLFGTTDRFFAGTDSRISFFEAAGLGTLFFDELGEIPISSQLTLLGALDETNPMYRRCGSLEDLPVHCRILAATNQDLSKLVEQYLFRNDLLFRFNDHIYVPPLRERKEEIKDLLSHFNTKYAKENGQRFRIDWDDVLYYLEQQDWPGNVRQLENVFRQAAANTVSEVLIPADFTSTLSPTKRNLIAQTETSATVAVAIDVQEPKTEEKVEENSDSPECPESEVKDLVINFVEKLMNHVRKGVFIRTIMEILEETFVRASVKETQSNQSKAERKLWGFKGNGMLKRLIRAC